MKLTRIRAITVGIDPDQCHPATLMDNLNNFYTAAEAAYQQVDFPIQTRASLRSVRLNTDSTVISPPSFSAVSTAFSAADR